MEWYNAKICLLLVIHKQLKQNAIFFILILNEISFVFDKIILVLDGIILILNVKWYISAKLLKYQ